MFALLGILFVIFLLVILVNVIGSIEIGTWISFGIGLVVIVGAIILLRYLIAALRKPAPCQCCGKVLKGTEQQKWGWGTPNTFIVCKECATKIHPQIVSYAKEHWSYRDFADYLSWDEETRLQRASFTITEQYGEERVLMVDTIHGLFSIGKAKLLKSGEPGLVFRFEDLADYDINFKPEEVKEGVFGEKVSWIYKYEIPAYPCAHLISRERSLAIPNL